MKYKPFLFIASLILFSCKKDHHSNQREPKAVSDTLMIYNQKVRNGTTNILIKSFKTGEVKTLTFDGTYPFATNLRLVYIKHGNILGFAKLDGVARLLIPLTQPTYPSFSIDLRLICLVDKNADKYQLLKYDTLGNKTILFETVNEITSPSFSPDGSTIVFAQKTTANSSTLFIIPITAGGIAKRVTTVIPDSYDEYCTVTQRKIYFIRSRSIDSTFSSEIFSSDFGGSSITQLTNFTNNWTTPSFFIKDLRRVGNLIDTSSLICVSNYNNLSSDIYLYKIGGGLTRMTETDEPESFPSFIPDFVK